MDVITLSLAKKYANKVAAGYSNVRVDGMNLIFTLNDGSEVTMAIPAPADGKDGISVQNLSIDKDGSLLCHMSDGSVIDAGKVPMTEVELTDYYTKEEVDGKVSAMRTPKSHDGEGMIGWYGTAVAGDNLTEAYGVTPDIIRAVNAGDYISWPSRVQTGAIENTICLYQMSYEVYNKDEGDYLEAIDIKIGKSPDVTYTYIIVGDNVYKETF